jgi:hypothetical protein
MGLQRHDCLSTAAVAGVVIETMTSGCRVDELLREDGQLVGPRSA